MTEESLVFSWLDSSVDRLSRLFLCSQDRGSRPASPVVRPDARQESQSGLQQSHQSHQVTSWPWKTASDTLVSPSSNLSFLVALLWGFSPLCSVKTCIWIPCNLTQFPPFWIQCSLGFWKHIFIWKHLFFLFASGDRLSTSDTWPTLTTSSTSSKTEYWCTTGKLYQNFSQFSVT